MTSLRGRAFVQMWAGWWFLACLATCPAQQTEAETRLVETIKAAAEDGHPDQQCTLDLMYFFGEHGVAQNQAKAVFWWRKAAEQGYADGQHKLGSCYYNGDGLPKDAAEAWKWARKAPE